MQTDDVKRAEIVHRRDHYWNAADYAERLSATLSDRRAFFSALVLAGRLKPPVLEIGAEFGVNAMVLQNEFGLPTVSVDLSRRTLQAAAITARLLAQSVPDRRIAADGERLPFARESFGTVLLWGALSRFDDPTRLLTEIDRVLAPGGTLIAAEEPIRRRLQWPLRKTPAADRLRGVDRVLLWTGVLPFVADVGAADNGALEAVARKFTSAEFEATFAGYQNRRFYYRAVLPGGAGSAGPLARAIWAGRSLVDWCGGFAHASVQKPVLFRSLGNGRYVARKDPRHNRIAVRGFSGAFMYNGRSLTAAGERAELPIEDPPRTSVVLDIPRFFTHVDFWDSRGQAGLVAHFEPEPPPVEPLDRLACPDCVAFTDRCVYGFCETECVAACPLAALEPTDPKLPVKAHCDGCGDCLRACPYGGIDRPVVKEGRCTECRTEIDPAADVIEGRPRLLRARLDLADIERVVRF
jgi:SAM-dependent methyltransferase/ferredoxin